MKKLNIVLITVFILQTILFSFGYWNLNKQIKEERQKSAEIHSKYEENEVLTMEGLLETIDTLEETTKSYDQFWEDQWGFNESVIELGKARTELHKNQAEFNKAVEDYILGS